jgi:3-hydroxyacyl-CoA dehydrogenase
MNNPPVNGLGYDLRVGIVDAVDAAMADPAIKAVVLTGTGQEFSGGADIREFNSPKSGAAPNLRAIIAMFDNCQKPIVAAINGVCMGGGLELTLGCHYRVGRCPTRSIALPEIKLGLLPGAGGTQRMPRIIGVEHALNLIVSVGRQVAVIGAGTMGGGITMNFLNAGIPVKMLEMKQEALDRGVATIRKNYEAQVKKGKLKQDKYEQRMAC